MKIKKQIPNMITWSRLGLLAGSLVSFVTGNYPLTLGLFIASATTDKLDGFLARKLNCVSSFGAKLDAVCDKALSIVGGVLTIPLGGKAFIIPIALELAIMGYNLYRFGSKKQNVESTNIGKAKTVALDTTMALGIAKPLIASINPTLYQTLIVASIGITGVAQVATLGSYIKDDKKQSKKENIKTILNKIEEQKKDVSESETYEKTYDNEIINEDANKKSKPMVRSRYRK